MSESFSNQSMRQPCVNKPHIQRIGGKWRVSSFGLDSAFILGRHLPRIGNKRSDLWKWNVAHAIMGALNVIEERTRRVK